MRIVCSIAEAPPRSRRAALGALLPDDVHVLDLAGRDRGQRRWRVAPTLVRSATAAWLPHALAFIREWTTDDARRASTRRGAGGPELPPPTSGCSRPVRSDPARCICIGLNYRDHAAESKMPLPSVARSTFSKYVDARVTHPGGARRSCRGQPAGGLRGGARRRDWPPREARARASGPTTTCSATRTSTTSARATAVRSTSSGSAGKSCDTFAPMGPAIVRRTRSPNPHRCASACVSTATVDAGFARPPVDFGVDGLDRVPDETVDARARRRDRDAARPRWRRELRP